MLTEKMFRALMLAPTDDGLGLPAMFWGRPGAGKTKILKAFARRLGMPVQVLSPGLMGEGAFGVTPVPIGTGKEMRITYPRPSWSDLFEDAGDVGLVFIDEITTAQPALQPPLLGLIQERRVGDHYLGERVRVLAAGNPPAQAAAGWDLAPPIANRMGHFEWERPAQGAWAEHMRNKRFGALPSVATQGAAPANGKGGGKAAKAAPSPEPAFDLAAAEAQVAAGWDLAWARAFGLIDAFTTRRAELLDQMPAEGDPKGSRAWPSLRTWDLATSALATAGILGCDDEETHALVAGFVGDGAASEFIAFQVNADLPDPEAVLDGAIPFAHDPARLDRTMAMLAACAALVAPTVAKSRDKRAKALWKIIGNVLNDAHDVAVNAAKVLAKADLGGFDEATPTLIKLRPVMTAAGITVTGA